MDTNGKIAFIGHPASRKLEEDINTLLEGKPLKGVKGGAGGDDEDDAAEFKDLELSKLNEEIARFETEVKKF